MTSETPESELPEADAPEMATPEAEPAGAEAAAQETPEEAAPEETAEMAAAEDAEIEGADAADDDAAEDEEVESEDVGSDEIEADGAGDDAPDSPEAGAADFDNLRLIEALLFASAEPLAPAQIARFLPEDVKLDPLLGDLQALYANRGVNLVKRGGRWAFRTAEDLGPRMEIENKVVRKLSRVALETLAVIAYHQPVTRAEIEEVRGVALSKGTLDALLEIGWIRPKGRRKTPGRPVTWGTSDAFLDHFGLEGLDALPGVEELKAAGLLDTRPALTALSDRGLLPAAGDVAPEEVDDEEDDEEESEIIEGSERELLEATFGEDMLPQDVDLTVASAEAGDGEKDSETDDAGGKDPGSEAGEEEDLEDEVLEAVEAEEADLGSGDPDADDPEEDDLGGEEPQADAPEAEGPEADELDDDSDVEPEDEPQRSTG